MRGGLAWSREGSGAARREGLDPGGGSAAPKHRRRSQVRGSRPDAADDARARRQAPTTRIRRWGPRRTAASGCQQEHRGRHEHGHTRKAGPNGGLQQHPLRARRPLQLVPVLAHPARPCLLRPLVPRRRHTPGSHGPLLVTSLPRQPRRAGPRPAAPLPAEQFIGRKSSVNGPRGPEALGASSPTRGPHRADPLRRLHEAIQAWFRGGAPSPEPTPRRRRDGRTSSMGPREIPPSSPVSTFNGARLDSCASTVRLSLRAGIDAQRSRHHYAV